MSTLYQHGLVKRFRESSGYNDYTDHHGIQKRGRGHLYAMNTPEKMLKDFLQWMKDGAGRPKERDLDYRQIGSWIAGYRLPNFDAKTFAPRYGSKLVPSHALIIWQLKGCVSAAKLAKAFRVDVRTIGDIWNGKSWANLTESYEASL